MKSTDPGFPLMDANRFLEYLGGDPALCVDILETGVKEWDAQVTQIKNLNGDSDKEFAIQAMHSLRGGSATFEALSLVALLQKMESACEVHGVSSVLPHLGTFEVEALAYREGLDCMISELRALL